MNNDRPEKEKMLAEAFHGEWNDGAAAGFALAAAKQARRRTRLRRAGAVAGAAAGIAALALLALRPQSIGQSHPEIAATSIQPPTAPAYEIISDEELLAQLKDQPLLVFPKKDGRSEFVLLQN